MKSIERYAYDLCKTSFGPVDLNPSTQHLDGAVYYLICEQQVLPNHAGQRDQYLEHLKFLEICDMFLDLPSKVN
jgi:hypothetical protein